MAYFNDSTIIFNRVQNEAHKAAAENVEFMLGLNLQSGPPWTETFWDNGLDAMEETFDNVSAALRPILGYDFTRVIHTYGTIHLELL